MEIRSGFFWQSKTAGPLSQAGGWIVELSASVVGY
jgi:hypothetical protein